MSKIKSGNQQLKLQVAGTEIINAGNKIIDSYPHPIVEEKTSRPARSTKVNTHGTVAKNLPI